MPRKLSSIAADWWDYTTLDDDIIRYIANQRQWIRLSSVKVALCNNPKCPLPIAPT